MNTLYPDCVAEAVARDIADRYTDDAFDYQALWHEIRDALAEFQGGYQDDPRELNFS